MQTRSRAGALWRLWGDQPAPTAPAHTSFFRRRSSSLSQMEAPRCRGVAVAVAVDGVLVDMSTRHPGPLRRPPTRRRRVAVASLPRLPAPAQKLTTQSATPSPCAVGRWRGRPLWFAHATVHCVLFTIPHVGTLRTATQCARLRSYPKPLQLPHTHTPTGKYTAHTVHWGTSLPPLSLSLSVLAAPWLATTLLLLLLLLAPAPRSKGGGGGSCRVGHR